MKKLLLIPLLVILLVPKHLSSPAGSIKSDTIKPFNEARVLEPDGSINEVIPTVGPVPEATPEVAPEPTPAVDQPAETPAPPADPTPQPDPSPAHATIDSVN